MNGQYTCLTANVPVFTMALITAPVGGPPVFPPCPNRPVVVVAHTIIPAEKTLSTGIVECCMWKATGQKTYTNMPVGQW